MATAATSDEAWKNAKTIYEFKARDINGNEIDLSKYKLDSKFSNQLIYLFNCLFDYLIRGRVVLIVNVACQCGFTGSNYPQMQELHRKYEPQGLSVLAFPCNQFGGQEPNPEAEIKDFVKKFSVEFDMFSKIKVNGEEAHPLYKFLKSKVDGTFGSFIKWNFSKFLVNREGVPVKRYSPTTEPKDIEEDIIKLLNQDLLK